MLTHDQSERETIKFWISSDNKMTHVNSNDYRYRRATDHGFFNPEVLARYCSRPSKYQITDYSIKKLEDSSDEGWDLDYGIASNNEVYCLLHDLSLLPTKEQKYWQGFNLSAPQGTRNPLEVKRNDNCSFENSPKDDLLEVLRALIKLNIRNLNLWQPKKNLEVMINEVILPLVEEETQYGDKFLLPLGRLVVDGFDIKNLRGLAATLNIKLEQGAENSSITILEKCLTHLSSVPCAKQAVQPLRKLQEKKSAMSSHGGKSVEENTILQAREDLHSIIQALKNIVEIINPTLATDDFLLHYAIEGEGRPAIVIGSHNYYPRTFSDDLRNHLQLIFMDHRGFAQGGQKDDESAFELSKILDDIRALQQKMYLKKVIIIGHSVHALMALEYAKKYPTLVSKIVLIASSPITGPDLYAASDRYFTESVCPERKAVLAHNLVSLEEAIVAHPNQAFIIRMLKFGPMIWYDYNYDARPLWEGITLNPKGADVIWGPMFANYDISQQLNYITCPVFLALGRYDYWNPPHLWEPVRDKFTDLTIRVFEKSSHTPQLEEAVNFDRELLKFLDRDL